MMPRRPLPRLHALTDARIAVRDDLGTRAAAIAAVGPAVALHARNRSADDVTLAALADRLRRLAAPPEAALFVNARADIAAATHAHGVQLGADDLAPTDARRVLAHGPRPDAWIGRSVHGLDEARTARDEGADYLLFGNVWETATHPGRAGAGLAALEAVASLGLPTIAVGGVTPHRAAEARDAGAWGVAAIGALWDAADPYAAARALLAPWMDHGAIIPA
jgi:thiamine-phosphate diphosphorylase